jgi:hypothetical protein
VKNGITQGTCGCFDHSDAASVAQDKKPIRHRMLFYINWDTRDPNKFKGTGPLSGLSRFDTFGEASTSLGAIGYGTHSVSHHIFDWKATGFTAGGQRFVRQ